MATYGIHPILYVLYQTEQKNKLPDTYKIKEKRGELMALTLTVKNDEFVFHGRSMNRTRDKNTLLKPYNKQICNYGLKLEMFPTEEQAVALNQQIGNARFVRNNYLAERNAHYQAHKGEKGNTTLTTSMYLSSFLPKLKEENPFLYASDKFALANAVMHVDDAFKRFFKHESGFPKFTSKWKPNGNKYTTNMTNNNIAIETMVCGKEAVPCVKLPKVGRITVAIPRGMTVETVVPPVTEIKTATISKEGNRYYVSFGLEYIAPLYCPKKEVTMDRVFALDLGLTHFCVYGTNTEKKKVENPRWIKKHEKRLRRLQQSVARKQYDKATHTSSKNRLKAQEKVRKEHLKIRNQRKDFQHKLSRMIADNCDVFICEDLNIKGMMKNRHLSKAIASVGWGQFVTMMKYKVERNNGTFLQVGRFFPSTRLCTCGFKNDELTLKDRVWVCPQCHRFHDRDEHAVDNMIKEGMKALIADGYTILPAKQAA